MLHGVTETQIEEYLESQRQSTSSTRFQFPSVPSLESADSHLPTVPSEPLVDSNHSPVTPSYREPNSPPHELKTVGTGHSQNESDMLGGQGSSAERAAALSSVTAETISEAQQFSDVQDAGQSTSCVAAARIVASMRNYPDIRDLRSELGCDSESNCMVKNMSIFDMLDK